MNASQDFEGPAVASRIISYQAGAIVSRILTKTPNGSVTMFAFDKGQELSEHTVPFEAVVSVVDGEGLFTIGGAAHTLRAGDVIRMPAGVPHAVRATESFKMMLSMVKAAI